MRGQEKGLLEVKLSNTSPPDVGNYVRLTVSSSVHPEKKMTQCQFLFPLTAHGTYSLHHTFEPKVLFNSALCYIVFILHWIYLSLEGLKS